MSEYDDMPELDDEAVAAARDRVAEVLAGANLLLGDDALWVEPPRDLEATVVAAIAAETGSPEAPAAPVIPLRRRAVVPWLASLGVAAAVIVAFVAFTRPASPDWTLAMGATDAMPGAAATVLGWNEDAGTRVELEVTGLPTAPDGFIYELWFSNDETNISAGTFNTNGDVTLWAPVTRRDFPRILVTLEPIDSDPSPAVLVLDTQEVG